jgi:hypothetical protein
MAEKKLNGFHGREKFTGTMIEFFKCSRKWKTVRDNQEVPCCVINEIELPKYLASFIPEEEVLVKEDEDDEGYIFSRKPHKHEDDGSSCQLLYCGLSFDSSLCHKGFRVSSMAEAISELHEAADGTIREVELPWISDITERKKNLKVFSKAKQSPLKDGERRVKKTIFGCFELEVNRLPSNFSWFHDGRICPKQDKPHHVTVFPALMKNCLGKCPTRVRKSTVTTKNYLRMDGTHIAFACLLAQSARNYFRTMIEKFGRYF